MKAKRVCSQPGCPELTTEGACEAHRAPPRVDYRASASKRGYGGWWTKYSAEYRKRHPWCRACQAAGRRRKTQLVDHIKPVTGPTDPGFRDPANHQPLCRNCHSRKTHSEGRTSAPATPERTWYIA